MPTFLKKCPACGKRFEVEHTGEKVEREEKVITVERPAFTVRGSRYGVGVPLIENAPKVELEVPIEEDIKTETYTCKHCGHVWTETRDEAKRLGRNLPSDAVDP